MCALLTIAACAGAVLYFYISWKSYDDTVTWVQNNIGIICADTSRSDYTEYCTQVR